MTSPAEVLRVDDLEVSFGGRRLLGDSTHVRAVDGVSLTVQRGEVFCIAGESGSGKTTLARTLVGLVEPTAGKLSFDGIDPTSMSRAGRRRFRRRVQMVFQDPIGSLNPRQTVYEAVAEPIRIHHIEGDESALVADALGRVGLRPPERFFLDYPHELSGGQRQRVVIAAALVTRPEIVVADEPVSMLDASVRGEILELLMGLRAQLGMTLILITHDLGVAWAVADRVAVMYLGKIVEIGPAERVLTAALHPYTQALLSVTPEIGTRKAARLLSGEPPDAARVPPGCRFHPRCPVVQEGRAGAEEDRCRSEIPDLRELEPGHLVACHVAPVDVRETGARSARYRP